MKTFYKNKKGAILAETLIAISMLVAAAVIVSQVATGGSRIVKRLKDETIAQNHLVSAVELIKNVRDSLQISREDILQDGDEDNCWKVLDPGAIVDINVRCQDVLRFENAVYLDIVDNDGYYIKFAQTEGQPQDLGSGFSRRIKVIQITDDELALINIKVSWDDGEIEENFVLFNYLK